MNLPPESATTHESLMDGRRQGLLCMCVCVCKGEINSFCVGVSKGVLNHGGTNSLPLGHYGF